MSTLKNKYDLKPNLPNLNIGYNLTAMSDNIYRVALAGNPNVGKSTVFNELTGMKQHTGNWPGKTVTNAQGSYIHNGRQYMLIDLPGTYSLLAHSAEEEVARNYICFDKPDAVIVVCDATCLERNINLVLQTMELTDNVVVCVNLVDEAEKKHIEINTALLSKRLGVPVVATNARCGIGVHELFDEIEQLKQNKASPAKVIYHPTVEAAIKMLMPCLEKYEHMINVRWLALRMLENDSRLIKQCENELGISFEADELIEAKHKAIELLKQEGIDNDRLCDTIVTDIYNTAEIICKGAIQYKNESYNKGQLKTDKILTGKWTGIPIMLIMVLLVFWITISGANYPSQLLFAGLSWIGDKLTLALNWISAPQWLSSLLIDGIYKVLSWVVSVMLPPMAIFFPLFTLLEDAGYLPRVAFNMDKCFKKCGACGKQALTMCMGFGCNAVGVTGCRIIDSPRERLIAVLTNSFVPCNGRFPTIIAIISMFLIAADTSFYSSLWSAILLTLVILLGIAMTFAISKLLSKTILRGVPSSFVLELPPFRKPQIGKIIVRSIMDRTIFVLGRAIKSAIPAGLIIWIMANVCIGDVTLLNYCSSLLDPFAQLMGLDGVILLSFILGLPANEIVIPIMLMAYMQSGQLVAYESLTQLKALLISNGWTWVTAVCTMLFMLMHWPCATTLMTVKKETQSLKWTALAFLLPTICGVLLCMIINGAAHLLGA